MINENRYVYEKLVKIKLQESPIKIDGLTSRDYKKPLNVFSSLNIDGLSDTSSSFSKMLKFFVFVILQNLLRSGQKSFKSLLKHLEES